MVLSLAAGAQNVRPQLGTAEAEQAGIKAAGANFSLAKGMPEGQHRSDSVMVLGLNEAEDVPDAAPMPVNTKPVTTMAVRMKAAVFVLNAFA
jgi:hypothetical protein